MTRCPRHPWSPVGAAGGSVAGQCWACRGRPSWWTCSECKRRIPCEHLPHAPSLTPREAELREQVVDALVRLESGTGSVEDVEARLDRYVAEVRDAAVEADLARSRN